jgi:hypothetical protein
MKTMILIAAIAFSGLASAGELILTQEAGKNSTVVALDMLSTGDAASVDFAVDTGVRGNDASIDVANCGAKDANRVSKCVVRDGVVYGGYFSPDASVAAKGAVSLGSFTIKSSGAKAAVLTFSATDGQGKEVAASIASTSTSARK